MTFTQILQDCLAALDAGASVEECLTRYPEYAGELTPLLQTAAMMRNAPAQQLADAAFVGSRTKLWAAAQQAQAATAHSQRASRKKDPPMSRTGRSSARPTRRMQIPNFFAPIYGLTTAAAILALLLAGFSLIRTTGSSLPGDPLYSLKRASESAQGVLMTAAGDSAAWHTLQVTRRFDEVLALETRDGLVPAATVTRMNESVNEALDATTALSSMERQEVLANWLGELQILRELAAETGVGVGALDRTIATVETAARVNNATQPMTQFGHGDVPPATNTDSLDERAGNGEEPAIWPLSSTPITNPILTPTATISGTRTATPTMPPTATLSPTPTSTATPLATATATPAHTITPTPTVTPTETPRPTATPTRRESSGGSRPDSTDTPTPLPSPTATATPEFTATPEATSTDSPPVETPSATHTPDPNATPTPITTAEPTPIGTPDGTVAPTLTPDPTLPTPEPTGEPTVAPPVDPPVEPTGEPPTDPTVEPPGEPSATPATTPNAEVTPPPATPTPDEAVIEPASSPPPTQAPATPEPPTPVEPPSEPTPEPSIEPTPVAPDPPEAPPVNTPTQ